MRYPDNRFYTRMKSSKGILVLGHRGCRKADVWENTLAAFDSAFDVGADGIEIDVETSADGQLVVINRWFANQTLGFFPWQRELATIQDVAGKKGIKVPTFDAVCQLIQGHPEAVFNVEIKSNDRLWCQAAMAVGHRLHHFGIAHQTIVSSFDLNTLLTMKRYHPAMETAYLFRQEDRVANLEEKTTLGYRLNGWINRTGIKGFLAGAGTLHPEIKLVHEKRPMPWLRWARWFNRSINCWTVDSESDLKKALALNADMIISDHPARMVACRHKIFKKEFNCGES